MSAAKSYVIYARRSLPGRRAGSPLLSFILLMVFVAGCAGSPPTSMPAVVPPTETPAVAAETSLWYQASTAFSDGRYSAAIHLYERYLTNYPKSRRALEAHWDLGQAYEQMGEVTAAIKEYRTLAGPEGAPFPRKIPTPNAPSIESMLYATNRLRRPAQIRSYRVVCLLQQSAADVPG
ncbi:MAG: tetratricopeptide repeat protein [Nitrospira sp.]|nr:tetratricopeptide repeat protein [Nitrospira sp.]